MQSPVDQSTSNLTSAQEFGRYWPLLLGCFLGAMCGVSGLFFYTQGIFIKPIAGEFEWSRTTLSLGAFISLCANAVLAPVSGAIIDRVGVRIFATLSLVGFAIGLWLLSTLNGSITQYYLYMILFAVLSTGTTPLSFSRAANEWFNTARGTALGIVGAGIGVSAAIAPGYFAGVVAGHGWRQGYISMALVVAVAAPIVWFLIGSPAAAVAGEKAQRVIPRTGGLTGAVAIRSSRFWLLGLMLFSAAVGASAIIVHFVPMMTDAGLTPQKAAGYAFVIGMSVTGSRIIVGVLLDRIFAPYIALVVFGAAALGAIILAQTGVSMAWLAALLMGFALGTESDLTGYMIARYFGMKAYGFIYGTLYAAFLVGMASGPVLAGMVFDHTKSYHGALIGAGVLFALAALLSMRLGAFPDFSKSDDSNPKS